MADIVLTHSAKGTTWQKKGSAYISRVKKNGKWVYTYASNKAGQASKAVATGANNVINKAEQAGNAVSTAARNANKAARSAVASSKYNPDVISTRLRKKTRRNVAKGKKKVSELLERLKNQASASVAKAKKKATYASKARAQRKSKRTISRERTISKVKKNLKNIRSGVIYSRGNPALYEKPKPVSKNAIKKNAGKKR